MLDQQRVARRTVLVEGVHSLLLAFRIACLLPLLLPLVYWRRSRGRRLAFLLRSAFACVLLFALLALFAGLVGISVGASSSVTAVANPESAMLDAGFDLADAELELWLQPAELGGLPLGPGTADMRDAESANFAQHLLENLQYIDVDALTLAANLMTVVFHLVRSAPYFLPFLIAGLFLFTTGFLFRTVAWMPVRALAGERHAGWHAFRFALRAVWREVLSLAVFLGSMLVPLVLMNLAVRYVGYGIVDELVGQVRTVGEYMARLTSEPDQLRMTVGLLGVPIQLMVVLGLFFGSAGLYLLHARRITQRRFHEGVPLRAHGFWRPAWLRLFRIQWGAMLLIWFVVPATLSLFGQPSYGEAGAALGALFWRGLVAVLVFLAGLWLLGTHRDLLWLLTFRVRKSADASVVATQEGRDRPIAGELRASDEAEPEGEGERPAGPRSG